MMPNMDNKYIRTTITIPEELLYEIKKKALSERKSFKETVEEGLKIYLGKKISASAKSDINSLFGAWGKGVDGKSYLKKTRYVKGDKDRDKYLQNIWKKS